MQKFIKLKELATNTVGGDNEIFSLQLQSLLKLYNQSANEVNKLEEQIISLISEIHPKSMTIPGIGPLSAAVIYAEYGDINKFYSPSAMLSFAGLEPGYYQSGTTEHGGHMVKRGSSPPYTFPLFAKPGLLYTNQAIRNQLVTYFTKSFVFTSEY